MIATTARPSAAEQADLDALEAVIRRLTAAAPNDAEVVSVGYYLECLAGTAEPYDAAQAVRGLDRLIATAARFRDALS